MRFDLPFSSQKIHGVISIAEVVDERLPEAGQGGLARASDAQVARMVDLILDLVGPDKLGMSARTRKEPHTGRWSTPAVLVVVLADNQKLGGGGQVATLGAKSTHKEHLSRQVLSRLRGQHLHLRVWGVAVDVNRTSMEQGRSAGPFIGLTIFAVYFTKRFREECKVSFPCDEALAATGASTGGALLGSALSSVVGFAILAFAPMPMFAAYGLLSAVMILIAAGATLLVLPSLLALITPKTQENVIP